MQEHRGKVVVIKYGGAAMDRAPLARPFAQDVALLLHSGISPVIVHGGGPQVTEMSTQLGHRDDVRGRPARDRRRDPRRRHDGARGKLNTGVVSNLLSGDVPAVGLSGVDGGLLLARRQTAPDLGFVGEVVSVNAGVARTLLDREYVPVIASIAMDEFGQAYNVNADVVAAELAVSPRRREARVHQRRARRDRCGRRPALRARGAGVLDLLAEGDAVAGGMIPKLESAVRALKAGISRVHLVDGRVEHGLVLELFTPEGVGTMITPDASTGPSPGDHFGPEEEGDLG